MFDYAKLTAFFDEYAAHYQKFLDYEYSKADMLNKDEIEKLSKSLATEQALIMKTSSYEGRRVKLMGNELTFTQVIEEAPPEYKERLESRYNDMTDIILKIKEINDSVNAIVASRLKHIQSMTAELNTYNDKGTLQRKSASNRAISRNV